MIITELKNQLNPIIERYKTAVSKSLECFLIGNHDPYEIAASKSEEWITRSETQPLNQEQLDAIVQAWNKSGIADEQYEGKVK